jgi:uncharacterized membrane protein YhaH (DUF805 family)
MSDAARPTDIIEDYFINVFRYRYIQYEGRARRKEFWFFHLFSLICGTLLNMVIPPLGTVYALAALVPSTCLTIRRLHDIGRSGWWYLLSCVPFIGLLILLIWFCHDSQPGENQYGPYPKDH